MSTQPQLHVRHTQHQGHGIDHLSESKIHDIAEALGYKHRDELSGLDAAERLSRVQGSINHLAPDGHIVAMQETDPDKYRKFAMALGFRDPDKLTHVGRCEQADAVQKRIQDLAL